MFETPELSVIVVTHSKPKLLVQYVRSIYRSSNMPTTEILVYRSGNPLDLEPGLIAKELAKDRPPFVTRISVIEDSENLGAPIGTNVLSGLARGRYLFICNDDCIVNVNDWYTPLRELIQDPTVGVVCSHLIQGEPGQFDENPDFAIMEKQISLFAHSQNGLQAQLVEFHEGPSNQPWFLRKEDIQKYCVQDPIINQMTFMCEWIDPHGAGWFVDWDFYHRIKLAGLRLGVCPQSTVFHYGHVTCRDMDKHKPGWTEVCQRHYSAKWQTGDKELNANFKNRKFVLQDGVLTPV